MLSFLLDNMDRRNATALEAPVPSIYGPQTISWLVYPVAVLSYFYFIYSVEHTARLLSTCFKQIEMPPLTFAISLRCLFTSFICQWGAEQNKHCT